MDNGQLNWIAGFIWNIADDVLRDVYVRGKYRDVILPMTVIRRLDAVLEFTKQAVLRLSEQLDKAGVANKHAALCQASGNAFYNVSPFTLRDLRARAKQQQLKADFEAYLDGFSPNVQEILDKFKFRNQVPTLIEADILGSLIEKFTSSEVNLSPDPVRDTDGQIRLPGLDNHAMGTIFEELIRRFNEENNEEAGEHFTPRDVVKLMANLIFLPTSELIALALSHAYASQSRGDNLCWPSLRDGFIIPVDDVQDLLPPVKAPDDESEEAPARAVRPDLLYVRLVPRAGLEFRFIEVKYRRHLRDARSPELVRGVDEQIEGLTKRWHAWYSGDDVAPPFRAARRAKLARVLRFYADKARRHADDSCAQGLSAECHQALLAEIDRMVEKGSDYTFASEDTAGLGWIFCPEYAGQEPLDIAPGEWDTQIFLFGPRPLPDGPSPFAQLELGPAKLPGEVAPKPPSQVDVLPAARSTEADAEASSTALPLQPANSKAAPATPADTTKAITVESCDVNVVLGKDLLSGGDVSWSISIKGNPHLLVAGLPGMGKTTCLLNMVRQMVAGGVQAWPQHSQRL